MLLGLLKNKVSPKFLFIFSPVQSAPAAIHIILPSSVDNVAQYFLSIGQEGPFSSRELPTV